MLHQEKFAYPPGVCYFKFMTTKQLQKNSYGYQPHKDKTLKRLARIEGQVRGVSRMVEDDQYCIDILTQISAAQKALDIVAMELLESHVGHCMLEKSQATKKNRTDELMSAVKRLVKAS